MHSQITKQLLRQAIVALFVLMGTAFPGKSNAQAFKAEGTIAYIVDQGKIHRTVEKRFVVQREKNQWKIRTFDDKDCTTCTNSVIAFYEAGGDGTNTFYLEQDDLQKLRKVAPPETLNDNNFVSALATVEQRLEPRAELNLNLINFIWQAYASSSYYSSLSNDMALSPLFSMKDYFPEQTLPAQWTFTENRMFVNEITWRSDGTYLQMGGNHEVETNRYSGIYSNGFVQAVFRVLTWTNFNELSVPASFSLVKYVPSAPVNGAAQLKEGFSILGQLDSIQMLTSFSYLPEITSATLVKDARYSQLTHYKEPLGYRTTSHWYTDTEVREYLASLGTVSQGASVIKNARSIVILSLMVLITLIFMTALLINKFKRKQNQTIK